ncbi:type II toxin-antitoxin system RelE/ParE family toxin [Corynebacterium appendicis]|uniref:type II toxin-antitoxin system RelE/ParE family toxin n=1 Tax=Corynebacterium appendicis TaxID=163202 RepID=UPI00223AC7E1|nr:type II toxin-antitoxin system RelE/ParE family toxin [Corynebacterium appendicis]MCT1685234.1 type II toxin-antitoxin system RelE/ParE family toxin [Corynebacterium appendicis]
MTYRLKEQAVEDLRGIWSYSETQWGPAQAERYLRTLERQFAWIADHPTSGKLVPGISGYRQRAAGSHMIIYRLDGRGVIVVRVLHQKMDPSRHL